MANEPAPTQQEKRERRIAATQKNRKSAASALLSKEPAKAEITANNRQTRQEIPETRHPDLRTRKRQMPNDKHLAFCFSDQSWKCDLRHALPLVMADQNE